MLTMAVYCSIVCGRASHSQIHSITSPGYAAPRAGSGCQSRGPPLTALPTLSRHGGAPSAAATTGSSPSATPARSTNAPMAMSTSHTRRSSLLATRRTCVLQKCRTSFHSPWATTTARQTLCAAGQPLSSHHSKSHALRSWPAVGWPPQQGTRSAQLASPWVSEPRECRITRCSGARGWRQLRSLVRRLLWVCCKGFPAKEVEKHQL